MSPLGPDADRRVLRIYHSGVVRDWRARDRALADEHIDVTLITPHRWNEGGRDVELVTGPDEQVVSARTVGRHPYRFVYDPRVLWRVLRNEPFDVIDIHEEPASLATAEVLLLARLARRRTPVCLYCAQNIEKRYPVPFRWFERIALRRAAAVHTCNEAAGAILRRKGFRGVVENLGLGVDERRFDAPADAAPGSASDAGPFRVGYVGRLEAHKGVGVLIDAVADLPAVELEIVGAGPERDVLERQVARLGLAGRVTFTGFRPADQVAELYASFDVLSVPSLETPGWIEQFGRVAVEAMAAGVPVVASASGSLVEVVGHAGVLVPPGDVAALTAAIDRLATTPEERLHLAEASRIHARRWSWSAIARRQAALYRVIAR